MKVIRSMFLALNTLIVIATFLSYLAPQIDPNEFWMLSLFGLAYPYLLILNICFILIWAVFKPKFLFISLTTLLIGWIFFKGFIAFHLKDDQKTAAPSNDISIVSFNISNASIGWAKDPKKRNKKTEELTTFLDKFVDEDILCFQEVGGYAFDILSKKFSTYQVHWLKKGAVIFSKHPIVESGEIDFGTRTNSCLWANIKIKKDTFRVYSVHLQSNQITKDADEVASGELDEEKTINGIKGILKKYKTFHIKRAKQSKIVKAHMLKSPHPVALCGDLNDTHMSFIYKQMSSNMVDAFVNKGKGLGTTFKGSIPFLRIDYIFLDPAFSVKKFKVIKENYSDHYPIGSIVSLENIDP